jgi:hypothetical protein
MLVRAHAREGCAETGHSGKDSRDVVDIIPADVVAASLVSTAGFLMQVSGLDVQYCHVSLQQG